MPNKDMIPIEVIILTDTDDIKGTVFVSSTVAANRQLTELLNDNNRRFLAVTNVEIYAKNSNQPPKRPPKSGGLFIVTYCKEFVQNPKVSRNYAVKYCETSKMLS